MAIYLVQHGHCLSKQEDPEKGLSAQGVTDVKSIARVAAGYGIEVNLILHSGKKRALQTASSRPTAAPRSKRRPPQASQAAVSRRSLHLREAARIRRF